LFGAVQRLRRRPLPSSTVSLRSPAPLIPSSAVTLGRTLRLLWQADPPRATTYLLITVIQGILPLAAALLVRLVLNRAGSVLAIEQAKTSPVVVPINAAMVAATWYVAIRFAGRFLPPLQVQLGGNLLTRATGLVEQRLMTVAGGIPDLDHFERQEFQDEIAFLQREVSWRPKNLLHDLHDVLAAVLTLGGSMALLWRFQPLLPLALLVCGIPQVLVQVRLRDRTYQSITRRSEAARQMAYAAAVTTDPSAAKELLVYGVGPWFQARWRRLADEALAEMARLRRAGLRGTAAIIGGNGLVLALGYAYVAAQVGNQRLTIGDFALYLSIVAGFQQTLFQFTAGAASAVDTSRYMARLFAFLYETHPSIAITPPEQALPVPARLRQGIELRDIWFSYPGQKAPVLRGVTCTLRAGETVAVVGENGAGKTTLVKLLTRLYDPSSGEILLDGVPLAAYNLAGAPWALRRQTAVLFQDFAHFALSAQHNIGVGDVQQVDNRERVLAAAHWVGADGVLNKLPGGLDTPLTRAFEGGVDLSGGEWQKIAMARAAMRDAALVILDEPTAALDAQAEYELFQRFRELAAVRTVLLISHRFSTVRMADRILVLEGGFIIEDGSHAELVALGGRYATLFEMQAGRYR
jgi:ATP-binding cassette subfamily B protein